MPKPKLSDRELLSRELRGLNSISWAVWTVLVSLHHVTLAKFNARSGRCVPPSTSGRIHLLLYQSAGYPDVVMLKRELEEKGILEVIRHYSERMLSAPLPDNPHRVDTKAHAAYAGWVQQQEAP